MLNNNSLKSLLIEDIAFRYDWSDTDSEGYDGDTEELLDNFHKILVFKSTADRDENNLQFVSDENSLNDDSISSEPLTDDVINQKNVSSKDENSVTECHYDSLIDVKNRLNKGLPQVKLVRIKFPTKKIDLHNFDLKGDFNKIIKLQIDECPDQHVDQGKLTHEESEVLHPISEDHQCDFDNITSRLNSRLPIKKSKFYESEQDNDKKTLMRDDLASNSLTEHQVEWHKNNNKVTDGMCEQIFNFSHDKLSNNSPDLMETKKTFDDVFNFELNKRSNDSTFQQFQHFNNHDFRINHDHDYVICRKINTLELLDKVQYQNSEDISLTACNGQQNNKDNITTDPPDTTSIIKKKFDGLIIDQGETTYDCHFSKATEHSKEKSYQSMHYDNNDKDQIVIEQINLSETIDNDQIDLNQDIEDISCKSLDQYCNEEIKGQDDLFTKLPGKTFDTEKNYVEMLFTNGMVSNKLNIKFDKNIESAQSKLMNQLSVIGEKDNSQDICVRQINQDFNKEKKKNTAKMTSDISNEDNLIDIALLPIDMVDIQTLYDSEQDMLKYSSEYKISEQLNTILSYQLDGRTVDEVRDDDNILEDSPQLSPVILRNRTMRETNDLLNDSGSTQTHDETYNDDPSYINEMNLSDMTVASLSGLDSVDNLEKSVTLPAESDNAHSELLQDQLSHENEEENNDPGLDLAISKEIINCSTIQCSAMEKKYACPFCHKILVGQLPRHIRNVHGNIEDVKKLNNTSKGSAERKEILTVFRNNGAFSHNCNELYNKGTYTKANARKHISQCRKKQGESKNLKGQRVYYVMGKTIEARMLSTANDILRLVVFPVLQEDEIVRLIRYDWLIILYGNKLCIKYTAHYQHNMIRARLRLIGRLLFAAKQINSTITQLADLFHPKCIQTVINAIGQIARINYLKNTCEVPAVALNVVTYIRQIAVMLETEYVVREEDQLQKQVANFLKVYNSEMSIAVNKVANESQAQLKRHKVVILPMSEDIQKLIIYIKTVKKIHFTNLKETFDQSWLAASKLVAAYLLVFNRRRVGDVQNITVSDIDRLQSIDKHADKEEYNALDDEGKKIARNYYRIEIRGKLNKDVAVIASNDIIDELRLLISYRALADVPSDNDFVFGLPNGGTSRIRVINLCTVMRNLSVACGAEKPELLRGTQLRKHVATKCVEFELSDNALSDLTKHMGHSEKIHKDYYRKPIKSKTIVQVTKLLHAVHGTVDDKNDEEEDININDESEYVEYDSFSHSTGNDNMSNIPSETNEIYDSNFSSNSTQIPSGTEVIFDNVVPCTSSANYSSVLTDNGQFCEQNTPKDKPVVAMVSSIGFSRKKPYSSEEKRAIMTEFKDHFINQTLPSFEKIDELLAKYPCLKNRRRDWIKSWIHSQFKKKMLRR
ncbi:uncharacterized protein LOC141534028 [Cotesia typhae]|uniref:uncharacterized protein LOC141534028 n=1 Tax=Cotesia typhae TaxID=2053667 RepID=UPI003D68A346